MPRRVQPAGVAIVELLFVTIAATSASPAATPAGVLTETLGGLLSRVKTAYLYVNNHFAGHSPASIRMLQETMGLPVVRPERMGEQLGLF